MIGSQEPLGVGTDTKTANRWVCVEQEILRFYPFYDLVKKDKQGYILEVNEECRRSYIMTHYDS